MKQTDLTPPKVISRARPRKEPWPTASFKLPESDLRLVDAAAGLLTKQEGTEVNRSDVLYSGAMRFVRQILGLPEAA